MTWLDRVDPGMSTISFWWPLSSLPPNASGSGPGPSIELGCLTGKARDRGGCREGEVRGRISATLIDRYLFPSPLAWKNTRSSMSTEINKRKPPNRSSPPLWFSRGLAVTFPQDKVVTKVTPLLSPSLKGKRRVGGVESGWANLFSNALHPPPHLQRRPGEDWQSHNSGLMRRRLSAWPFLKCIRGSKDGTFPRSMQR